MEKAKILYDLYVTAVGRTSHNDFPLPNSENFFANPANSRQIKGWIALAEFMENKKETFSKTLHNSNASTASKNVKDIIFWGNGNTFKLISKASSENEGWMKSTKAMEIKGKESVGCVVQVTTQQGNNIAEALTYVPGAYIEEQFENEVVISRKLKF